MLRVRYALFCMLTMRIKRAKSNDKNLFSLGRIRICDRRREIDEFLKLKQPHELWAAVQLDNLRKVSGIYF